MVEVLLATCGPTLESLLLHVGENVPAVELT